MYLVFSIILHVILLFFLTHKERTNSAVFANKKNEILLNKISILEKEIEILKNELDFLRNITPVTEEEKQQLLEQTNRLKNKEIQFSNELMQLKNKENELDVLLNKNKKMSFNSEIENALFDLQSFVLDVFDADENIIFELHFNDKGNIVNIDTFSTLIEKENLDSIKQFRSKSLANRSVLFKFYNQQIDYIEK